MQTTCFPPYPTVAVVGGVAHIYVGNQKLHETSEPAFLFDHYTGTVLRYGDRSELEVICGGMQESYRKYEMDASELEVVVFPAATTTAEQLKSFIEHRHALEAWIAQNKAQAA